MRVLICSPLGILHTLIIQSSDPDAKYSPFGENATVFKEYERSVKFMMRSPLDTLHTPIVSVPNAKYSPFGENATLQTENECPVSLNKQHIEQLSILDIYSPSFFS